MDCYEDKVLSPGIPPKSRIGVHHTNYSEQTREPFLLYVGLRYECAMKLVTYVHCNACM